MASGSELVRLYVATFDKPPSRLATAALLRMEQLFGMTQDDPLARMLIVQLHVANLTAEIHDQRTLEEKGFVEDIRALKGELHGLVTSVDKVRTKLDRARRGGAKVSQDGTPVVIDTYRKGSPLWSYLGGAFQRRYGSVEADERIVAARLDLFYFTCIAGLILMCGIYIGRTLV